MSLQVGGTIDGGVLAAGIPRFKDVRKQNVCEGENVGVTGLFDNKMVGGGRG